ncbi:farnesol dehydrogenase-like [Anopheles moucheti]|uniref:farnesol dehydrogenase-like n=1 Tax=Anopheles moucheti TaxID=186751 RepID=UPI0022F0D78F|nr:farnesol dehydrogenase-like [Anopheles moucheti]
MDRWTGKVAVVTGASSGIGAATAKALVRAGMITIGLARRVELIETLKTELPADMSGRLHGIRCDVTREKDILAAYRQIETQYGGVDVQINCAGIARNTIRVLQANNTQDLRDIVNTNLLGLTLCSREAYLSMQKRSVDGHIVHINSIVGHSIPPLNTLNIYPAVKYGITALTETMRQELRFAGTKIKVTSISPGFTRTPINPNSGTYTGPILEPEDIADAILYALGTPPRVQIHELTIKPVGEVE